MARCAICRTPIIFGGREFAVVRYCSEKCEGKGKLLAALPAGSREDEASGVVKPMWVVIWALLAVSASVVNFWIDMAGWKQGVAPQNAVSASLGYALSAYVFACACFGWKKYRNLQSYFKFAAIISIILVLSGIGRFASPPGL